MAGSRERQIGRTGWTPWTPSFVLLSLGLSLSPLAAQEKPDAAAAQEQTIVYIHTVATTLYVAVDDLGIYATDSAAFGVWNYQFNLSSWLDTQPHRLTIKARFGNRDGAYCRFEVRSGTGVGSAGARVLAEKTVRATEVEKWNREVTLLSLSVARPAHSVRPLWVDPSQIDLQAVTRRRSADLLKEVFDALRGCHLDALMALIDPALTNQALMEGAPPELVKRSIRALLQRDCIPGIALARTRRDFHQAAYEDVVAPLNFEKLVYRFSRDESREDKRGNLFTLTEPILIKTRDNRHFAARPFLSYPDGERKRRFVSRFVFERTQ